MREAKLRDKKKIRGVLPRNFMFLASLCLEIFSCIQVRNFLPLSEQGLKKLTVLNSRAQVALEANKRFIFTTRFLNLELIIFML
jgi:hypothetical protein